MTLNELQQLFYQGDFENCIIQGESHLLHTLMKSHLFCEEYEQALLIYEENKRFMRDQLEDGEYIIWLRYAIQLKSKLNDQEHVLTLSNEFKQLYITQEWDYDSDMEIVTLAMAEAHYKQGAIKEAHLHLDEVLSYGDADPLAHHFKSTWRKPEFLSKFGF